jgi:hypothetical protein
MPVFAFPAPYPFATGDELNASNTFDLFWDPTAQDSSLMIVNGHLDEDNFEASLVITHELTQRGSQIDGWQVSGTANLDFRDIWFSDYDYAYTVDEAADPFQYIPGGNVTFNVKWDDAYVLLMWTVTWMSDNMPSTVTSGSDDIKSTILLLVDGEYQDAQRRNVGKTGGAFDSPVGFKKGRTWTGHCYVALEKGHHTAGLAILSDKDIRQSRVYAVSIIAVPMRAITDLTP